VCAATTLVGAIACGSAPDTDLAVDGTDFPAPVQVGCIERVDAGRQAVASEGLTYEVSVPAGCLRAPCGMILDVHGGTMSAEMEENNTRLSVLGAERGYVVVQPNAAGGLWNAAADDPKVFAFMLDVARAWHLDTNRIHMTGFSQGGYMTWRFLCAHSDVLASAAPAAAAGQPMLTIETLCEFAGPAGPARPIPILYMHGTQDGLVSFQNALVQRDAIVARYGAGAAEVVDRGPVHVRTRFEKSGTPGAIFEFLQHDYSTAAGVGIPPFGVALKGHCYPGSTDFTPSAAGQLMPFACTTPSPSAFNWGELALEFFVEHPKR
jgi:hypothetical protein